MKQRVFGSDGNHAGIGFGSFHQIDDIEELM